jgi:hypothetical protein
MLGRMIPGGTSTRRPFRTPPVIRRLGGRLEVLEEFIEFVGTYGVLHDRDCTGSPFFAEDPPPFGAPVLQQKEPVLEGREGGGADAAGTGGKIPQYLGKVPFQVKKIVQNLAPFKNPDIVPDLFQQNIQGMIQEINVVHGFFKKNGWIRVQYQEISQNP